jgi:glucokinase
VTAEVFVLAGDVGGTKTDIAIFASEAGVRAPLARATFQNQQYTGLEAIALEFLERTKVPVAAACFDVAGPVVDGVATITNLPWVVSEASLKKALHLESVHLLNDLEATALAVPILGKADLHTLSAGRPTPNGPIAIIAPGTGLGEAFLTWDGEQYRAHATEGGHTDFGPTTPQQIELLAYLLERFEHVSYELVCSGIGIPNLYQFLKATGQATELAEVAARLATADDETPVIMEAGLATQARSELSAATLELFASILGAESGNLALKVFSTGGVFIGGGIPPRMLPVLELGGFMRAFLQKGRLSRVLVDMPVHVILSQAALIGAAQAGLAYSHAN